MQPNRLRMRSFPDIVIFIYKIDFDMNNDVIKTTKTVTTTGNQQYKRRDRSVSPETALKISSSLKSYNATHPRGKASDGSQWSKRISDSLKNNYWSSIPPKQTNNNDVSPQNGF